ncbi:MAG TPA: SBBP repeat-containing protein [Bryobacteraceae bacterium]|nr:SBBP repeat-containing protein [Bryobacteraceae bacterium]
MVIGTTRYPGSGPGTIEVASFGGSYPSTRVPLEQSSDAPRSGIDTPLDAAFDSAGNLWVVGSTTSDDFSLANPIVAKKVPYRMSGFVMEVDPTGANVKFASYLGGQRPCQFSCSSYASAVTADSAGNVYIAGTTDESDFPVTPGAYLTSGPDIDTRGNTRFYTFLLKISASGNLVYSTFLGTGRQKCQLNPCFGEQSTSSRVDSLAVDGAGAVTAAESMSQGPGRITRLSPDGSKADWTTDTGFTLGGITRLLMARDSAGNVKLFGAAAPLLNSLDPRSGNGPATLFVEQVSPGGSVTGTTMLGEASDDARPSGIAQDSSGNIWLDGTGSSTSGSLSGGAGAGSDFLLELEPAFHPVGLMRFPRGVVAAGLAVDAAGEKLIPGANSALLTVPAGYSPSTPLLAGFMNSASFDVNTGAYPGALVSLIGVGFHGAPETVNIAGVMAPVLYAGPNQINVQIPFEAIAGVVNLSIPAEGISIDLPIARSLGIFTTDGVHAAAVNQDGTVNSASNPAPMGSVVTIYGTGAVWPYGMADGGIPTGAAWLNQEQNGFQVVDLPAEIPQNILYAGAAPEIINGVFQMNVMVPPGVVVTPDGWQVRLESVLQNSIALTSNTVGIYVH